MLALITIISFSSLKFTYLVTNRDPKITNALQYGVFNSNETALKVNTNTFGFAFKVSDFLTDKALDDPSMVRWFAEIVETDG